MLTNLTHCNFSAENKEMMLTPVLLHNVVGDQMQRMKRLLHGVMINLLVNAFGNLFVREPKLFSS